MSINPSTRLARLEKINERRIVKNLNNPGKRLLWVRTKLNLTQTEIAKETGIPCSSYFDRENGVRTEFFEEYLLLATYLDKRWQAKYGKLRYPEYCGEMVKHISPMFIIYGTDDLERNYEAAKASLMEKVAEMKAESERKQAELDRQIELFKAI